MRVDTDTIGDVEVPSSALWSSQTQRSVDNFPFGEGERHHREIITALAAVKAAAALANKKFKKVDARIADEVRAAAMAIYEGGYAEAFPLVVWQTGSGTQSNMNMNEVIANLANVALGGKLGDKQPVHPNDHVNHGQSSNDVFPSAMSIATTLLLEQKFLPAADYLIETLKAKSVEFEPIVKIGRTHMMDAVPMTLGQEFGAFASTLTTARNLVAETRKYMNKLALGGTAVGTGLNSYPGFDTAAAEYVSEITGVSFRTHENKFAALSSITHVVALNQSIVTLATVLMKIANDMRLLASGPRAGLAELCLPANEPGSSIMPGKVNPTQCESTAMICAQVIGSAGVVTQCNTYGHLQLNVFLPVTADVVIRNLKLLSITMRNIVDRCLKDTVPNKANIAKCVQASLMLCTALAPTIGYDKAAKIAKNAHEKNLTLKESALELGLLDAEAFDAAVKPEEMAHPLALESKLPV